MNSPSTAEDLTPGTHVEFTGSHHLAGHRGVIRNGPEIWRGTYGDTVFHINGFKVAMDNDAEVYAKEEQLKRFVLPGKSR